MIMAALHRKGKHHIDAGARVNPQLVSRLPRHHGATVSTPRSPENRLDLPRHRVDVGHSVDLAQNTYFPIVGQERRGLPAIDLEARMHRLWAVIWAMDEFAAAADIAHACGARPAIALVIAGAAAPAAEPTGQPVDQSRLVNLDQDDVVEAKPALLKHVVERLRLRHRSREPVEDKARMTIGFNDALRDQVDDDPIGNQLAGIHDGPSGWERRRRLRPWNSIASQTTRPGRRESC